MLQKGGGSEGEQGTWRMKRSSYGDGVAAKGTTLEASSALKGGSEQSQVSYLWNLGVSRIAFQQNETWDGS